MTKIVNILNSKPLSEQPLNHGEGLLVPLEYTGDNVPICPKNLWVQHCNIIVKKNIVASILDTDELLSGIYISDQR